MKYQKLYNLYILTPILWFVMLALLGCTQPVSDTASASMVDHSDVFKVAILLPGAIDDQGWSQGGYEGLQLIEQELRVEVAYSANVPDSQIEQIFRHYAEEGYDFIIGHGGQFLPAAEMVAEEFPHTNLAVMAGYAGNNKNLGGLGLRLDETGYLLGVVAALKSKTHQIAYLGCEPYADLLEESAAFEQGAKATRPSIDVSIKWVHDWTDEEKTRQMAQSLIEDGADVLMVRVDEASRAAFEVAQHAGVYAIGSTTDQNQLAPDTILSSNIIRMPLVLLEAATLAQQGLWEGKQYRFGLREGALELAPFYGLLTSEEEAMIKTVRHDMLSDKIDLDLDLDLDLD